MSIISLIIALLIEQVRPLPVRALVLGPLARLADTLEQNLNGGERRHGVLAWGLAALLLVGGSLAIHALLWAVHPVLAYAFGIFVLTLTLGFRQFSHWFTDIQSALAAGDLPLARRLLAEWRGRGSDLASSEEVARLAIEEGLAASHRHVFAVALWYVLLPGPCGAVLYRLAALLAERWAAPTGGEPGARGDVAAFGWFARHAFQWLDWLPTRITAASFAAMGDFEDAIYCWRTQARQWPDPGLGIILAAGAGALGVRLGEPVLMSVDPNQAEFSALGARDRPELGVGEPADADFMRSAIGLVWRALLLWLLLLWLLGHATLLV